MFWIIRILDQITYMLTYKKIQIETLFEAVKYLEKINDNKSFIAVLGMASFVSYFCHYIDVFFQWVR